MQRDERRVDGVPGPAVRRGFQGSSDSRALGRDTDHGEHPLRDGVLRHRPRPAHRLEGFPRPLTGPPEHRLPSPVVGFGEVGKQAAQRLVGAGSQLGHKVVAVDFGASALQDPGRPHDRPDDLVALRLGALEPALHAHARLLTLSGCGRATVVHDPPGRLHGHDVPSQFLGALLGEVHVKGRVLHAALARLVPHLRPGHGPLVAEANTDGVAPGRIRVAVQPQLDPSPDLRLAVHRANLLHDLLHRTAKKLLPACRDLDLVAAKRGSLFPEGSLPVGALGGLDAVLVGHFHQHALVGELLQLDRHGVPEGTGVACDFFHKQVGERAGTRPNPKIQRVLPGQLADQKHQPAQVGPERALRRPVVELRDAGVDLVQQHIRADQVGRERAKQVAGRNHGTERLLRDLLERVVQDPEL